MADAALCLICLLTGFREVVADVSQESFHHAGYLLAVRYPFEAQCSLAAEARKHSRHTVIVTTADLGKAFIPSETQTADDPRRLLSGL
jgi:hypothetical protein